MSFFSKLSEFFIKKEVASPTPEPIKTNNSNTVPTTASHSEDRIDLLEKKLGQMSDADYAKVLNAGENLLRSITGSPTPPDTRSGNKTHTRT